jgi:hypothetical protein
MTLYVRGVMTSLAGIAVILSLLGLVSYDLAVPVKGMERHKQQ